MTDNLIFGRNPVIEAINSGHSIDKILIQTEAQNIAKITALAKEHKIMFQFVNRKKLDELCEEHSAGQEVRHQGVVALVAAQKYYEVDEILAFAAGKNEPPLLLIADGITDPHNLGSIIRTANAAGVHGIIIPKNRSVSLNSTVAKISAGAAEYTRVAKVSNIAQTIDKLKKQGVWIAGTDLSAVQTHYETGLTGPLAIALGSEGAGMSRIVKEKCDFLMKIPMLGEIQSLNVAVATGVLLYERVRQNIHNK